MNKLFSSKWVVLLASVIINICIGTGYVWSVYQVGLFKESVSIFATQLTEGQLAMAFTICSAIAPVCMIVGEPLQRLLGKARYVVFVGGLCFGGGLVLSGVCKSLVGLYLSYGLVTGFGLSLTYGIIIDNAVKFFPDKRGLVAGITTAAFGCGSIIFPPIIERIMTGLGVQTAFVILGVVFASVIVFFGIFISSPAQKSCDHPLLTSKGLDNFVANKPSENLQPDSDGLEKDSGIHKNWKQMLGDKRFWLMILAFTIFATGGLMVITQGAQIVGALGVSNQTVAALVVSIIAIGNTVGRIAWGFLSDKLGRLNTLVVMSASVALLGFGAFAFIKLGLLVPFIASAVLIAGCYGGSMGVYPALTADNFGVKYNGVNYGIMFSGFALGGFIGPAVVNNLAYSDALLCVGVLGVVALAIVFVLKKISGKRA